jgi:putative flippase GtrA
MLGTFIDLSLFAVFYVLLGAPALVANTLSYSAGIVNNYIFHRHWTFAHRPRKSLGKQFSQFAGVSLSALVLNNLIVLLLTPTLSTLFPNPAHGALAAKICATGVGMGWNFLANHLWTFQAVSIE